jgi:hypothetical protein
MKIKTADGQKLTLNEPKPLLSVKSGDCVVLTLKQSSKYYHPFLAEFKTTVTSATEQQIIIKSPVKVIPGSKEKDWIIPIEDIALLKVDDEKSDLH